MSHDMQNQPQSDVNPDTHGIKRYQLRQKMVSIGNDYWVEDEQGAPVYKIDGKIGLRKVFHVEDAHGNRLAKIKKHKLTLKETMEISSPQGEELAVVKKDIFTPLKEHFVVEIKDGQSLEIRGNILDHEYKIVEGNRTIAEVSKKLFHVRDSYSISIQPGQEDFLILAVVLCIDEMTHSGN